MKTLFRILLFLIVFLMVAAVAGVAFLYARYPDVPPPENITHEQRSIDRCGARIVRGEPNSIESA